MAKVTISPVELSLNDSAARDREDMTTDHAEMTVANARKVILLVENESTAEACTISIQAGDFVNAGIGDLDVSVALSSSKLIGPFESSRFLDEDGKIQIETSSTGTLDGKIEAILLP
jgi:hypothetical protein